MAVPPPSRFADTPAPLRARAVLALGLVLLHGVLVLALIAALGANGRLPGAAAMRAIVVSLPAARPETAKPAHTTYQHHAEGASGAVAATAQADQITAPRSEATAPAIAAPVAGNGSETRSGAGATGAGSGGAGAGTGAGSGAGGSGSGAHFVARRPVKLAGELTEGDFSREGRARRIGTAVIVILSVGADGRVTACRVHQPSGDPDADAAVCRLAQQRFRFEPARDTAGEPVAAEFGWQQRFFGG